MDRYADAIAHRLAERDSHPRVDGHFFTNFDPSGRGISYAVRHTLANRHADVYALAHQDSDRYGDAHSDPHVHA